MDSVTKSGEDQYKVIVPTYWPNDWAFYYTISLVDDQYMITDTGIDP